MDDNKKSPTTTLKRKFKIGPLGYGLDLWNAMLFIAIIIICFWLEFSKSTLDKMVNVKDPRRSVLVSSHSKETLNCSPKVLYDAKMGELLCDKLKVGNMDLNVGNIDLSHNGIMFADSDTSASFNPSIYVDSQDGLHFQCALHVNGIKVDANLYPVLVNETVQSSVSLECPSNQSTTSLLRYKNDKIIAEPLSKYALVRNDSAVQVERSLLISDGENKFNIFTGLTLAPTMKSCLLSKIFKNVEPLSWNTQSSNILYLADVNFVPTWGPLPSMLTSLPDSGLMQGAYAVVTGDGTEVTGHQTQKLVNLGERGAVVDTPNAKIEIPHLVRLGANARLTPVPFRDPADPNDDVDSLWALDVKNNNSFAVPGKQQTITFEPRTLFPATNNPSNFVRLVLFGRDGKAKLSDQIPLPSSDIEQILKNDLNWYSANDYVRHGNVKDKPVKNVKEPVDDKDAVPWQCFISRNQNDLLTAHGKRITNVKPTPKSSYAVTVKTMNEHPKGLALIRDEYYHAENKVISKVGMPIQPTDAATLEYMNYPRFPVEYTWNATKSDWHWVNYNSTLYDKQYMKDTGLHALITFPCLLIRIDSYAPGVNKIEITDKTTNKIIAKHDNVNFPQICNLSVEAGTWIKLKTTAPKQLNKKNSIYLTFLVPTK